MPLSLRPHQLAGALSLGPPRLRVLSLDCFDTLLWRQTHRPEDVFAELAPFGITAHQRQVAEGTARRRASDAGREEVSIEEIYAALLPWAGAEQRHAAIAAELAAEARYCFAFPPAVALIRQARARGLRIVVVSNTYLGEGQLRALLESTLGRETYGLIDRVFCSSAYGVSKTGGLFEPVKAALGVPAADIFHIGDNEAADRAAPLAAGLQAAHLVPFDLATSQRLRLEAGAAALLSGRAQGERPICQPHRAQLALGGDAAPGAPERLGYGVIGPVLNAYADWLKREADGLAATGTGCVHLLFLMRDGFLPMQAYEALTGGAGPHRVVAAEISRFAAVAAALSDPRRIAHYLDSGRSPPDLRAQARQLQLTAAELADLMGTDLQDRRRWRSAVMRPDVLATIVSRACLARDGLIDYVRAAVDPAPGDTLVIADLGYNGTVQTCIEPVLRQAFGVEIAGRYLLLREEEASGGDKRGMIDGRTCDDAALHTLGVCIAPVEELCTTDRGSVVGYDRGKPLYGDCHVDPGQAALRGRVQGACLDFIRRSRENGWSAADPAGGYSYAAAALLRFLYLPLPEELETLKDFRHDVYLGEAGMTPLFQAGLAREGLREWGLFYMKGADRPFLPAEVRGNGLPLSLTMLACKRFGLELALADFRDRVIRLPIIAAEGQTVGSHEVEAHATHEGYYQASIPVGDARYVIGLQFGRLYACVQLASLHFWPAEQTPHGEAGLGKAGRPGTPIAAKPVYDGAVTGPGGLLTFAEAQGLVLVPPPAPSGQGALILSVVFRPIAPRAAPTALALAAE